MDVITVDKLVNGEGLRADGVEEAGGVAVEDFVDGGVAELRVEAADDGDQLFRRAAATGALDGFNGIADAVDAIEDGVGKIAIEQEEFKNAVGR